MAEKKPKNRARTRAIRERMERTGENYTRAARELDKERAAEPHPEAPKEEPCPTRSSEPRRPRL